MPTKLKITLTVNSYFRQYIKIASREWSFPLPNWLFLAPGQGASKIWTTKSISGYHTSNARRRPPLQSSWNFLSHLMYILQSRRYSNFILMLANIDIDIRVWVRIDWVLGISSFAAGNRPVDKKNTHTHNAAVVVPIYILLAQKY